MRFAASFMPRAALLGEVMDKSRGKSIARANGVLDAHRESFMLVRCFWRDQQTATATPRDTDELRASGLQ